MSNSVFDYRKAAQDSEVPQQLLQGFEKTARQEFGNDEMMIELHILRAIHEYNMSQNKLNSKAAVA